MTRKILDKSKHYLLLCGNSSLWKKEEMQIRLTEVKGPKNGKQALNKVKCSLCSKVWGRGGLVLVVKVEASGRIGLGFIFPSPSPLLKSHPSLAGKNL